LPSTVSILGFPISNVNMKEALELTLKIIEDGEQQMIATPNPEMIVQAKKDPYLGDVLREAALNLPDGIGLIWASRVKGRPLKEKVAGIEFMTGMLALAAEKGLGVYFLGAKPGVAGEAAENLQARFPGLKIAGVSHGYFTEEEEKEIVEEIKRVKPQILFAGLGAGRQEKWIKKYQKESGVPVAVGVGGSFDVLAGRLSRAPHIICKMGMEWLYRSFQEPSRIFRLAALVKFVIMVIKE